jgi:endonuclease/exonuclease/phosphatase family metal-dependent hydrolase
MSFTIVSLNAWGGRVHRPLVDWLATRPGDLVCLQEVTRTIGHGDRWLSYRDGDVELPQRPDLHAEASAALEGYQSFFSPMARGPLHDGETEVLSEFGLGTYLAPTHAVIGQSVGFIHGAFSPDGWGPHPRCRNVHGLRIHDYARGASLTVIQLHGLRDPEGKGDTPARAAQADALLRFIDALWPGDEGLVVCGDFNLLPDSHTFRVLARLGLVDLVTARGFTDTRTSFYPKPGRFADYLMVTPDVPVHHFEVLAAPEVSDHRALRLTIA